MKAIILILVFIGAMFYFFRDEIFFRKNSYNTVQTIKKTVITPLPAERPLPTPRQPESPTGWNFDHKGVDSHGYDWFTPTTAATNTTEWFVMRGPVNTFNTTYRVKKDCVIEFQSKDDPNKVTAVWKDSDTNESYLRLDNSEFSKVVIDPKQFLAIRMNASRVRFVPAAPDKTLAVMMGRKE